MNKHSGSFFALQTNYLQAKITNIRQPDCFALQTCVMILLLKMTMESDLTLTPP